MSATLQKQFTDDLIYCICPEGTSGETMIACDRCGDWYHTDCVRLTQEEVQRYSTMNLEYTCPLCEV
jgi:COMPASS component SPP1